MSPLIIAGRLVGRHMALADSTFVIRASFPERRILGTILRSNVIQPILRVARYPPGTKPVIKQIGRLYGQADRSVDRFPPYHTLVREPTSFGIPDSWRFGRRRSANSQRPTESGSVPDERHSASGNGVGASPLSPPSSATSQYFLKRSRDPAGAGAAAGPAVRSRRSQWTQRRT
jgi:hypothetical protein